MPLPRVALLALTASSIVRRASFAFNASPCCLSALLVIGLARLTR